LLGGVVTLLASLYLLRSRPTALERTGGVRLTFEVDLDRVVASKLDRIAAEAAQDGSMKVGRPSADVVSLGPVEAASGGRSRVWEALGVHGAELEALAGAPSHFRLRQEERARLRHRAVAQAVHAIRARGGSNCFVTTTVEQSGAAITVQVTGVRHDQGDRLAALIGRTAQLELRLVDEGAPYLRTLIARAAGVVSAGRDGARDDPFLQASQREDLERFVSGLTGALAPPRDRELVLGPIVGAARDGEPPPVTWRTYLLERSGAITGDYLADATVRLDARDQPEVTLSPSGAGAALLRRLAAQGLHRRLAIVLDGTVQMAPVLAWARDDGRRLGFLRLPDPGPAATAARDLEAILRTGAFHAPLVRLRP
jgi:preprotein translocase subunit SecD